MLQRTTLEMFRLLVLPFTFSELEEHWGRYGFVVCYIVFDWTVLNTRAEKIVAKSRYKFTKETNET